jgi:hypothetical protein
MNAILTLIQTLTGLIGLATSIRTTLEVKRQNGEMTPEEEAAYDAMVKAEMEQPWWKKSDEPVPPTP